MLVFDKFIGSQVMTDPDAPSPSEPSMREWVHWSVSVCVCLCSFLFICYLNFYPQKPKTNPFCFALRIVTDIPGDGNPTQGKILFFLLRCMCMHIKCKVGYTS